jgi:D-xylose 1-dehydrogenase (NADP+, D-xylono-1,5-lactone-forming)
MTITRWGILSTARINDPVLAAARASSEFEVAAIASRDTDRAATYAREHGLERSYGSYEELLEDQTIDAIYISLPNSMHAPWAARALEAGKHVLCEKPLARREADVAALFDTARRSGRLCMEGFMWRHHPQTRTLAELVDAGAIGKLRLVRASFSFTLGDPADVRLLPELGGGALMDVGCYAVSAVRLLAGEPRRVSALQVVSATGVDVRFAATLALDGDVLGQIDCAFDLPARGELQAVGSEGSLTLADPWHCATPGIDLRRGEDVEHIRPPVADSYRLELENLSAAIRGEAQPLLGREDAVGQARTIEALYESTGSGRTVELG